MNFSEFYRFDIDVPSDIIAMYSFTSTQES
jgi:hypothetical protein